jgi:hypothetical protein
VGFKRFEPPVILRDITFQLPESDSSFLLDQNDQAFVDLGEKSFGRRCLPLTERGLRALVVGRPDVCYTGFPREETPKCAKPSNVFLPSAPAT